MENYLSLGAVSRACLNMQAQYASRYADPFWRAQYTYCGDGLRIIGTSADYHDMLIHEDDAPIFVERVKAARQILF